ncbi:MAG: hypothetical protein WCJ95_05025, partial [Mariniphaga sp.]
MKNLLFLIAVLALSLLFTPVRAQVTVAGSAGSANGNYTTLKLAFDALNLVAAQAGNDIVVTITASTTETASAILNQPATSSWNTLTIYPTVTGLSISGDLVYKPIIDLNGADNVTINGSVGGSDGGKDLTINNTSKLPGTTSTLRFINDACTNTVKYCTIKGSTTSTTEGVISFKTAKVTTGSGNDGNTIDNNNITSSNNANRPVAAIYSAGTSASQDNSGNIISNNAIYNFLNPGVASNGIYLSTYNTGWTITGNNFYETGNSGDSFVPTAIAQYTIININDASGGNGGFTITNNTIGGNLPDCSGTWTKTGASDNTFYGIYISQKAAGTNSSVQGNTIKNINYTNSANGNFCGIYIATGNVDIGTVTGNTIGASTGNASITFTPGGISVFFYGIQTSSTAITNINQNIIGAITTANTNTTNPASFYGIYKTAGTGTINNNTIGSTDSGTTNSVNASSAATAVNSNQLVYGIFCSVSATISDNIISKLTNGSTNSNFNNSGAILGIYVYNAGTYTITNNNVSYLSIASNCSSGVRVAGINFTSTTAAIQTITGNTIHHISNSNETYFGALTGLYYYGSATASIVSNNFIHSLSVNPNSTGSPIGINIMQGLATYANNIISLGGTEAAPHYGTFYGIKETNSGSGTNSNFYFNTIYIGGTSASGAINSYAFHSPTNTYTRNIKNNIFCNARSNIGTATGVNYATYIVSGGSLTCDYNNYYAPGIGGNLGNESGTNFPVVAGKDISSQALNPSFANAGGTTATDYQATNPFLRAVTGTGIVNDYAGTLRSTTEPSMGAYDYTVSATVTLTASAGTQTGNYNTLKAAFDAINLGTHQGSIEILINDNTTEAGTAALYQSGYTGTSGLSSYTSVHIYPTKTGLSISGNFSAPLIDLNGADGVILDGRVGGAGTEKDLVISNTSILDGSYPSTTSTIRFINDATGNTVKYCTIKGSFSSQGIVFFSTATTTGNDNNIIDNNNITNSADNNRPINAIYSSGTSSKTNSGNIISNNNIYDFLNRNQPSNGIYLASFNTGWMISKNSFYETTTFIPAASRKYTAIMAYSSTPSDIADITISGNYIGGSAPVCGGTAWTKTNSFTNTFYAINLVVGPTVTTPTSIQGNTIKNFAWGDGNTVSSWTAINIYSPSIYSSMGPVNIGTETANTIGATTGNGSIVITSAATGSKVYGINIDGMGAVDCQKNTIGAITATNAPTLATNFYGINRTSSGNTTISNNTIGSTDAGTTNSINVSSGSTSNVQSVYGINNAGSGITAISGNTISKLTNGTTNTNTATTGVVQGINTNNGTNTITNNIVSDLTIANANTAADVLASAAGIVFNSSTNAVQTIAGNTITKLSNSYASFGGNVIGLVYLGYSGATLNAISKNFIHSLSVNSGSTAANLYGIYIRNSATTSSNNIINIGDNTQTTVYGIYETGSTASNKSNIYFNTIYIGGSPTEGNFNSYALYSALTYQSNPRDFRNNIFHNARSNSGTATGNHYGMFINTTGSTLTCDYNDYYVSGIGGKLGYYGVAKTILPIVTGVTGNDVKSIKADPVFASAGSTTAEDYIPSTVLAGVSGTGSITTDYAGTTRAATPTMGAYEGEILQIISFTPGSTGTGQTVTITGTNFKRVTAVTFGATAATSFNVVSSTSITAVVDNGATGKISVTTASGNATSTDTFYFIPNPPTGAATRTYISGSTVANLTATGTSLKWYDVASGGIALDASTVLVNGKHYYASQTIDGVESILTLDVTVTIGTVFTWTGAISIDWNKPGNWFTNQVPGVSDEVLIPYVTTHQPTVSSTTTAKLKNLTLDAGATLTIVGKLQVTGFITNNGTFSPMNYSTIEFNGSVEQTIPAFSYYHLISSGLGSRTLASSGIIKVAGLFTPGTNTYNTAYSTVEFNGSIYQTLPGLTFYNLTLNNTSSFLTGLSDDVTVNKTLTLTSGTLYLDYNLILGGNATEVKGNLSSDNMIVADYNGELRKVFTKTGSYIFPVGDNISGIYSPITMTFANGSFSETSYSAVRVQNLKYEFNHSEKNYLNRFWDVTQSGISGFLCDVNATYDPSDIVGGEANQVAAKYNGTWTKYDKLSGNTLTAKGVALFSVFTGINVPTVTIDNTVLSVCQGDPITLTTTAEGDALTYLWSDGTTTTTDYTPSTSGSGSNDYTVTVTDANGITATDKVTVVVNALPTVTLANLTAQCASSTSYSLTGGSPTGGTYSGTGVSDGYFDASSAGSTNSPYTITYTYTANGCTNSATNTITVYALPEVSFTGTLQTQCASSTTYVLTGGSPTGGTYSGTGVSGTNFNASLADVGDNT